jgi:hypothetical protein
MRTGRRLLWVLLFLLVVDFLLFAAWHGFNEQAIRTDSKDPDTMRLYCSVVELILIIINCPVALALYLMERLDIIPGDYVMIVIWLVLFMAEAWLYSVVYVFWRQKRTGKAN